MHIIMLNMCDSARLSVCVKPYKRELTFSHSCMASVCTHDLDCAYIFPHPKYTQLDRVNRSSFLNTDVQQHTILEAVVSAFIMKGYLYPIVGIF